MLRQIRLLVFDLDYVVFDCRELKARALRDSLISFADAIPHNLRLPDTVDAEDGFMEYGSRWIQQLQIGLDEEALAQLQCAYRIHEERLVAAGVGEIFPGLREFLTRCRENHVSAAIGAEAGRDYLLDVSDRHSLDKLFEMAFCAEEFGVGSTDEMFEEILRRGEVNPSEALALGTRSSFFQAAHNLDVLTVGCGWGLHRHESLSDADLQSLTLAQLTPAIEKADSLATRYLM